MRREQCQVFEKGDGEYYVKLNKKQDEVEVIGRTGEKGLTVEIRVEEGDRVQDQNKVVKEVSSFLDQFKGNINTEIERQQKHNQTRTDNMNTRGKELVSLECPKVALFLFLGLIRFSAI